VATYDHELLQAAGRLLDREAGRRGKLAGARVRRSISTSYYALFHFLTDEAGARIVGTGGGLLRRRRILTRTFTHAGVKRALENLEKDNPEISQRMQEDEVRKIVNQGMSSFYEEANADVKLDFAPVIEQLQRAAQRP